MAVTASASAADFLTPAAPPVAVPDYWSGVYVGLNAGYAWGESSASDPEVNLLTGSYDGPLGGAQIGVNRQLDQFVFGIEADIQASDIGDRRTLLGTTGEQKLSWFSTVRGRAGVDIDGFMPYLTAGLAFGRNNFALWSDSPRFHLSESRTHVGWTAGGGVEAALSDAWSVKAEYLYVDLGSETYFAQLDGGFKADNAFHAVRVGVNWRFASF